MDDEARFLVLDQGGHAGRALVFDRSGAVVARAAVEVPTRRSGGGIVEQDAEAVLGSLTTSLAAVAAEVGADSLRAAGLACQRSSVVCWNRQTGEALTPVLSWQDTRAHALFDEVTVDRARLTATTGLPPSAHYGATKLAWCLRNVPAVRAARDAGALACGPLSSFLLFRLLGGHPSLVNHSIAQRTLLFDIDARDWSDELLAAFDIPRELLPRCVPDRSAFGTLVVGDRGIPFSVCAGDQNAVPFAFGAPDPDTLYLNLGTGAFMLRPIAGDAAVTGGLLRSLLDGGFAAEGTVNGAGSAFTWLAQRYGVDVDWDALDRVEPAADMPLFINAVGDLGSPFWRTGVESRFVPDQPPFPQALYAVAESIAFLVRANHDCMTPTGRLLLAGGLSRSALLCRLIAAVLDVDASRVDAPDVTSRGVLALLGGPVTAAVGDAFRPDPDLRALLGPRYARWRALLAL